MTRRSFETEVRDEAWAPEMETALRDHLVSALPEDVEVTAVACKTAACEVTFEAADLGPAMTPLTEPDSYPPETVDIILGAIEPGTRQRVRVIVNLER